MAREKPDEKPAADKVVDELRHLFRDREQQHDPAAAARADQRIREKLAEYGIE